MRGRVLLEEMLALPAVGIPLHREGTVAQMRHEHVRDVAVIREQLALRDPLLGPEELVEAGQPEDASAVPNLRLHRLTFLAHLGGRLVLAQALVDTGPPPPRRG